MYELFTFKPGGYPSIRFHTDPDSSRAKKHEAWQLYWRSNGIYSPPVRQMPINNSPMLDAHLLENLPQFATDLCLEALDGYMLR